MLHGIDQDIHTAVTYAMTFIVVQNWAVHRNGPLVHGLAARNVLRAASWLIDSVEYDLLKKCYKNFLYILLYPM